MANKAIELAKLALGDLGGAVERKALVINRSPATPAELRAYDDIGRFWLQGNPLAGDYTDADPCQSPLVLGLLDKIIRAFNEAPPCQQQLNALGGWDFLDVPSAKMVRGKDGKWLWAKSPTILDLLYNPNDYQTGAEHFAALIQDRYFNGQGYDFVTVNDNDEPIRLHHIPSCDLRPARNDDSRYGIDFYWWQPPDLTSPKKIPKRYIIHYRAEKPHPADDMRSMSPLQYLNVQASLLRENTLFAARSAKNGGRPSMILMPNDDFEVGPEAVRRIEGEIASRYGGKNSGKPSVLTRKYKIMVPDFPPEKVFSEFTVNDSSAQVCLAMGVQPQVAGTLLGVKEGNMASVDAAYEMFWEDCILPLNSAFASTLTKYLLPYFEAPSRSRRMFFDLRQVRALSEDLVQRDERAISKFRWNVTTLDQALVEVNLPPLGGDTGKMRYSEFVASQARASLEPGGGTPMLPSGGGTSGDNNANAQDGQKPASGGKKGVEDFIARIALDAHEPLALNGKH
jgi:HK97 family phage portal protein